MFRGVLLLVRWAAMATWIAEERVVFEQSDGARVDGRIALASPTFDEQLGHASCAFDLDGMDTQWRNRAMPRSIHGETTLQALLLAATFVGATLTDFVEHGGRVLYRPEDAGGDANVEVALAAIFGPLFAPRPR
jgi:hypothetical protein